MSFSLPLSQLENIDDTIYFPVLYLSEVMNDMTYHVFGSQFIIVFPIELRAHSTICIILGEPWTAGAKDCQ